MADENAAEREAVGVLKDRSFQDVFCTRADWRQAGEIPMEHAVFTKPLRLILSTVLMTGTASPQDTPTLESRAAGASRAGAPEAARSGLKPTFGSDTSANAASTLLFGEQTVESQADSVAVGQAAAFQVVAINSGTVGALSIYLDASSASRQLVLGIYSGSGAGYPATLLGQGSSLKLQSGAWNTIQVPPINVTKDNYYWIAVLGVQGGQPILHDRHNAPCLSQSSYQTALTSLPATWKQGTYRPNSCPLSAYGLSPGTAVGVLIASPSSVNFENVIVGDSTALPVMLTNAGTASLTISAAAATGAGFGMSGLALPLTLQPGNKKSFSPDFAPAMTGKATGQISLTSNASNPYTVVALSGIGVSAHSVTLSWTASTSSGVMGYNVYRGGQSGGPYTVLNPALVSGTIYEDSTVQAGQTYYYVTAAVNSKGVESTYSNQVAAVVPSP